MNWQNFTPSLACCTTASNQQHTAAAVYSKATLIRQSTCVRPDMVVAVTAVLTAGTAFSVGQVADSESALRVVIH
jgi:hypothetical protein